MQELGTVFEVGDLQYDLAGFEEEVEKEIDEIWSECQDELEQEQEKRR